MQTGVLVVGAGIAGLSLALRLPDSTSVIVVTKGSLGESNTWYAQGGIAAAVGIDDDPSLHLADTLIAGAGLCDESAVHLLVEHGPKAIQWLLSQGTRFDLEHRSMALGREAAHSRNRILHAGGDATGAEIERSLVDRLRRRDNVRVLDNTIATDLLISANRVCLGATVYHADSATAIDVRAGATVLANGGAGQLWSVTSNPPGATGDGMAMALRAGVDVADLEFTQFHPTVLAVPGADPFLITEAIRGEGAYLLDVHHRRFMPNIHLQAELAPRDVVARAIQDKITAHRGEPVFLDLRHLDPDMVLRRFPTIARRLASHGISLTEDLVPVAPAAHYFMGGIVANATGQTSMPGLFAVGEVSCTGVHGANRLASNSLLEGLVFGLMTADRLSTLLEPTSNVHGRPIQTTPPSLANAAPSLAAHALVADIQLVMSAYVAVVRTAAGLTEAMSELAAIAERTAGFSPSDMARVNDILSLANAITHSALAREESRGAHFRADFPQASAHLDHRHQVVRMSGQIAHRRFGALRETPST